MSWETVTLADVKPAAFPEIPFGRYKFNLLPGASTRMNNFQTEELVVSAAITEGPQAGRRVFLEYPDPTAKHSVTGKVVDWPAQALKKLEVSLGVEQAAGETPVQFLNRVAGNGHAAFEMDLGPARKIRTGETEPRTVPMLFSVGPTA